MSISSLGFSTCFVQNTMTGSDVSVDIKKDYSSECEQLVNRQINLELTAAYQYLQMATFFDQHDVALPNLAGYFRSEAKGEHEHADKFIQFQLTRGARVKYEDLKLNNKDQWTSALDVMEYHLKMEQDIFECIKELAQKAEEAKDTHLLDLLDEFYKHQNDEIYEISSKVTILKRLGDGLGLYMFDKFEIKQ